MCGLLVVVGPCDQSAFEAGLGRLAHRGPDGSKIVDLEGIRLGHRRLAIVDRGPSGDQPMRSPDGQHYMVCNGEIYNHQELRRRFASEGWVFRSKSDMEVLLAGLVLHGINILSQLNGMFAFAWWDNTDKKLIVARDRLGEKPLYWSKLKNGSFVFSSEMKAIFPFIGFIELYIPLSTAAFSSPFSGQESGPETLIKGCHRIPPGCWGEILINEIRLHTWWSVATAHCEVPHNEEERTEKFRELLHDAVKLRMPEEVSAATGLSGGLDSSYVSGVSRQLMNSHALFAACFPGSTLDERKEASEAAAAIGGNLNFVEIRPPMSVDEMLQDVWQQEEPSLGPCWPMRSLYAAIRHAGHSVSIEGHGADELLGGYQSSILEAFPDALAQGGDPILVLATWLRSHRAAHLPSQAWFKGLLGGYENIGRETLARILNVYGRPRYGMHASHGRLDRHLRLLTGITILPTLLRFYDRSSMANGVELRMPFLDHRLVEFCLSLPWSSRIADGYTKAILRNSAKGLLPDTVRLRMDKVGFNAPLGEWLHGNLYHSISDFISSSQFEASGMSSRNRCRILLNEARNKPTHQNSLALWRDLQPALWHKAITSGWLPS